MEICAIHRQEIEDEAQDLVDACASQGKPQFEPEAREAIESGGLEEGDDEITDADEEVLEKCLEVIYSEKKASTSLLQRRLRLGYTRAARMIDILESRGIIGPGDGAKSEDETISYRRRQQVLGRPLIPRPAKFRWWCRYQLRKVFAANNYVFSGVRLGICDVAVG